MILRARVQVQGVGAEPNKETYNIKSTLSFTGHVARDVMSNLKTSPLEAALDIVMLPVHMGTGVVYEQSLILMPHKLWACLYEFDKNMFIQHFLGGKEDNASNFWKNMQGTSYVVQSAKFSTWIPRRTVPLEAFWWCSGLHRDQQGMGKICRYHSSMASLLGPKHLQNCRGPDGLGGNHLLGDGPYAYTPIYVLIDMTYIHTHIYRLKYMHLNYLDLDNLTLSLCITCGLSDCARKWITRMHCMLSGLKVMLAIFWKKRVTDEGMRTFTLTNNKIGLLVGWALEIMGPSSTC